MSRKSDVALPTIMNVFLMIAVILVASSFLLKAFGIDIWGFLKNLFGGMFLKPQKILFIKMDPGSTPQIHQFYLTSDKYHVAEFYAIAASRYVSRFMPLELPEKNCVIYTVDENSGGVDDRDEGYYYYIKPGTIIQTGCGENLGLCLESYIVDSGCVAKSAEYLCPTVSLKYWESSPSQCSKVAERFAFANCGCYGGKARCDEPEVSERKVELQKFVDNADFTDKCKNEREVICNLLVQDTYEIKYGLKCKDGIWQVCKEDNVEPTGGDCYQDGEYFKWITGKPTLTLSPNKEVYLPLDTEIQLKATTSTSPTGELFNIEVVPPSTKPKCTIFQGSDSCEILYNSPTVSGPIEFKATAYKTGAAFIIGEKIAEISKKVDVDLWTEEWVVAGTAQIPGWTGKNVKISLSDDKKVGDFSIRGSITSGNEISVTYQFTKPLSISSTQSIKFYIKANSDSNGRIYITDENRETEYANYNIGDDWSLIELKQSDFQPTGLFGGSDWNKIKTIEFSATGKEPYTAGKELRTMLVDYLHIYPPPEPTVKLVKDSSLPTMPTSEEES